MDKLNEVIAIPFVPHDQGCTIAGGEMRIVLLVAVTLMLFTGCATRRGEPISEPLGMDSQKLARGEEAYMAHCNKCHPGGETALGFAINNKPLPGFMIKAQVRAGAGVMPAFSKELVTGEDLDNMLEYIELLRKQSPAIAGPAT